MRPASRPQSTRSTTVGHFFDALTPQYAEEIERCFPRYREMLWALIDYLPPHLPVRRILELGCGTGNLSVLLADRYPGAEIVLVDVAPESLNVCRQRLGDDCRFRFRQIDFRMLQEDAESFDLVASSIAIHHLTSSEKQSLFARLYALLRPRGIFAYADQHAGSTTQINQRHTAHWRELSMAAGSTEEQWQMWMKHQSDHDHHDTMVAQIDWLRKAGFVDVDCLWRYLLWTVLMAEKPIAGGS